MPTGAATDELIEQELLYH